MMGFMAPMMMGQAVGGLETVQSLPPMTGPNSPSGYAASASSEFSGGAYPAYYAFDGNKSVDANSWISAEAPAYPVTLRRDLPAARKIGAYAMWARAGNGNNQMMKDWSLQGSNDGVSWTDIHSASGQTWDTFGERRLFLVPEPKRLSCSKYRWLIGANNGAPYVTAQEIELLFVL